MTDFLDHPPEPPFEDRRGENAWIHESAYVDSPCHIGDHTAIFPFSHIMAHTLIGNHCHIGHHVTIASGVMIGNNVRVMNNSLLNNGVILEDAVYCGPSTIFSPLNRLRGKSQSISRVSPTLVRRGSNIGANTSVASGVTIGQYTFIEAGSVIDRNVPDFALVYGNPLRFRGWRCECGEVLSFEDTHACCTLCGRSYIRKARHKVIQAEPRSVVRKHSPS